MTTNQLTQIGQAAKAASRVVSQLETGKKNQLLLAFADALEARTEPVLTANQLDLANMDPSNRFYDRLKLTSERIADMATGLRSLAELADPIGNVDCGWINHAGLQILKQRVPIGVVGMIYEARPNVTIDAAGLCFKSGNAVILRGGREALHSNQALAAVLRDTLAANGLDENIIQLITDPSHEVADQFMQLTDFVDVLIPRGSARLIQAVVKNASVPVIETGAGNCHVYVDTDAELEMAKRIVINAKVQRPSVCNATEKLLINSAVAAKYLPELITALQAHGVEVRGDERTRAIVASVKPATETDWSTEYNDLIIAVKVVDSLTEAIDHINHYGTGHSEAIVTDNYQNGRRFQQLVDAACVYVNASTRFTDGFEFGFGAEIGIATQKLHARGPMGLMALTSYKYVINGSGQTRQ